MRATGTALSPPSKHMCLARRGGGVTLGADREGATEPRKDAKETRVHVTKRQKPQTVWFQLDGILERAKLWRQ